MPGDQDSVIPDSLRSSTDPHAWAAAFNEFFPGADDREESELATWFGAALETGRHYGAKAALDAGRTQL